MSAAETTTSQDLFEIAPPLAAHLDNTYLQGLQDEARQYLLPAIEGLRATDQKEREPEALARWEAWSASVVNPLKSAYPDGMEFESWGAPHKFGIDFPVTIPYEGTETQLPLGLTMLTAESSEITRQAIEDAATAEGLYSIFNSPQITRIRPSQRELAKRVGYDLGTSGIARLIVGAKTVDAIWIPDIINAAHTRRSKIIEPLVMRSVNFNISTTKEELVAGRIGNPLVDGVASPYDSFVHVGHTGYNKLLDLLSRDEKKKAAGGNLDIEVIRDRLHKAASEQTKVQRTREQVADWLLPLIAASPAFQALTR